MQRENRRLAAIVAADIVGYSRLIGQDEEGTLRAFRAHRAELIDDLIEHHGGRIANTAGDSFLLEFPSAVDAVRCSIAIQKGMAERNKDIETHRQISFRIGINVGDVVADGGDLFGDGVNITARLETLSEPGCITLSDDAYRQIRDRLNLSWEDRGEHKVKNIARPIRIWRWSDGRQLSPSQLPDISVPLPLPKKPSIAVLPFENMSGDAEQEYFADGIASDLITAISRISWLFVTARNSSFAFKGQATDLGAIGAKLGVRYLLKGSVRKVGNRVRISVQLIEAASGNHLWADRYDGMLDDIFDLQDRITENVTGAIAPKLRATEIERSRRKRPENLEAFDFLLQALPHVSAFTKIGFDRAFELLNQAIDLDPNYSQALAYSAYCRSLRPFHGWSAADDDDFRKATELAQRAIAADSEDPIALMAAGMTAVLVNRDYEVGLELADRSLMIDSNSALSLGSRGWIHVWVGDPGAAIADFDKAMRLSPFDQWKSNYTLGKAFALNTCDQFEEGLRWARIAVQENPNWTACYRQLIAAHELLGHHDDAQAAVALHQAIDANFSVGHWVETGPFRRTANQERLFAALRKAGLPE